MQHTKTAIMDETAYNEVFRACQILFGPELDYSHDFLFYIQSSGIKSAYRKRALETHPDRTVLNDDFDTPGGPPSNADSFIETNWAYERLIDFISNRDTYHIIRHQPMRYAGAVVQPLRRRHKRRTRKTAAAERKPGGYYYKSSLPGRKLMFGEYLFYGGHVPWEALIKAIVWQRRQRPRFGDLARKWGWLTEGEISQGVRSRKLAEPLGQSLLRLGLISEAQLDALIVKQRRLQKPIGEFFVENAYLSTLELSGHLKSCRMHNLKFP